MKTYALNNPAQAKPGAHMTRKLYTEYLVSSAKSSRSSPVKSLLMTVDGVHLNELLKLPSPQKEKAVVSYLIEVSRCIH